MSRKLIKWKFQKRWRKLENDVVSLIEPPTHSMLLTFMIPCDAQTPNNFYRIDDDLIFREYHPQRRD